MLRLQSFVHPRWRHRLLVKSLAATAGLIAILLTLVSQPAAAVVRITDDQGGNIGDYYSRYQALRSSKAKVVIDGKCSSACTMILGIVPPDRICVTKNALLGFHAAWQPTFLGLKSINEPATRTLMTFYPGPIRQWIEHNGGLSSQMMYLTGPELMAIYRQCR
jgi:hypothetical protein